MQEGVNAWILTISLLPSTAAALHHVIYTKEVSIVTSYTYYTTAATLAPSRHPMRGREPAISHLLRCPLSLHTPNTVAALHH
eukprot:8459959-Pyramimonas_sp.AAC.1